MASSQPHPEAQKDLSSLRSTIETVLTLTSQFQTAVQSPVPSNASSDRIGDGKANDKNKTINALSLAHDAATLIRAHSSKLSLLCINSPFTPTAIITVLREVSSGPIPALASAVELCQPETYTSAMLSELQYRVSKTLSEFSALVREIPLNGSPLGSQGKSGIGAGTGKDTGQGKGDGKDGKSTVLERTGVLWQACDSLLSLSNAGIPGLMVQRANQYLDTLKDALEELQEWGQETSDEDEIDDEGYETGLTSSHDQDDILGVAASTDAAQAVIDAMFNSQLHIPTHDRDSIRPRLELSLRRLKLILLFYRAVIKRRFKILQALPAPMITERLDTILAQLAAIPHTTDELASAFYSLEPAAIDAQMVDVVNKAVEVGESVELDWKGENDGFSEWVGKFKDRMRGNNSAVFA